ncbi:hypothetical protein LLEC1_04288 [Akanthomyces lecanii]|uniref:NAD(P)-binding domain-containing protein n=1 Tax=Cordyceps confragosa TaxID=2714763 RepID=A0A179I4I1_CORDF|nr:hypothetical protein LLEC1_04288 [Akanthomyces lecanii]
MPSYAILGATGKTGQSIIKVLLQSEENTIHAYCRSKAKLFALIPEIQHDARVAVYEGQTSDIDLLVACLKDTRAAFMAMAPVGNKPGNTLIFDTAQQVVAAMERLKNRPHLVLLSSSSTDHSFMSSVPSLLRSLLYCANFYIYEDLKRAESYLGSHSDIVTTTFVKPGALSHDEQRGHILSFSRATSPVSFLDLAAGMIEIAASPEGDLYHGRAVAVNAASKDVAFPREAPGVLLQGMLCFLCPWIYPYIH